MDILDFVKTHIPKRYADSNKGSYGKCLMICGSDRYPGAPILACAGAVRSGAGLVELYSTEKVVCAALPVYPDIIYHTINDISSGDDNESIAGQSGTADCILIGCGCGVSENLYRLTSEIANTEGGPTVIDADALNSISVFDRNLEIFASAKRHIVITPHPLEFSRLCGLTVAEISDNRVGCATAFATLHNVYVLLKGNGTVSASPDGKYTVNTTGSSALAKAGSGDVLAGVITSFIAQGCTPYDAAVISAYLHGAAGDTLARRLSEYGVAASDLPVAIAEEIRRLFPACG